MGPFIAFVAAITVATSFERLYDTKYLPSNRSPAAKAEAAEE